MKEFEDDVALSDEEFELLMKYMEYEDSDIVYTFGPIEESYTNKDDQRLR